MAETVDDPYFDEKPNPANTTPYELDEGEDQTDAAILGEGELGELALGKEEYQRTEYTNDSPAYR